MQIRFAEAKDIPGILNLLCQVGKVHSDLRPDIFRSGARKYGPSQLLDMLKDPNTPIFVAMESDTMLGYGFCKVKKYDKDPIFTDGTELYVDDICVDEAQRGKGIGTVIYREICRYAALRKCDRITLNVWADNTAALRFYEKLGLKPQRIFLEQSL